jgi:hypothetical protein
MIGLTPDISAVAVVRHGVLQLTFADGVSGEVDVLERMHGPVFAQARTPDGFAEVAVDNETGTVVWPGGADLAPTPCTSESAPGLGQTSASPPDLAAQPDTRARCRIKRSRTDHRATQPLRAMSRRLLVTLCSIGDRVCGERSLPCRRLM